MIRLKLAIPKGLQTYGKEARDYLKAWIKKHSNYEIMNRLDRNDVVKRGYFGRPLVWTVSGGGGVRANCQLVRNGLAVVKSNDEKSLRYTA